jgi:pilus assembly protein CpaB
MNSRAFTLSLVIAGIAMFMVYSYIDGREAQFQTEFGTPVPVVVAKADIKELDIIDDRLVRIETVPQKFRQPGAFSKVEELYNTIAAVPIKAGEQITKPRVTHPGSRTGLSRQVTPGKRAFSINVTEEQAVGRMIKPGDRVDVLTLIDYKGGKKNALTMKTFLQDVYVLSTGFKMTNSLPLTGVKVDNAIKRLNLNTYENFNTLTLELTPNEVQKLAFMMNTSRGIYFSLRNNDDKEISNVKATNLYDVLGEDSVAAKRYFEQKEAQENRRQRR